MKPGQVKDEHGGAARQPVANHPPEMKRPIMRWCWSDPFLVLVTLVFLSAGSLAARADDPSVTLPELVHGAQQWAQDNLDSNMLNALPEVDERVVRQFFYEFQRRYQGQYVVDLAALRDTARTVLPLLESREETQPYAAWLKAQMDYLSVANEIRLTIPPPTVETNHPPPPVPNPTPQREREIWVR